MTKTKHTTYAGERFRALETVRPLIKGKAEFKCLWIDKMGNVCGKTFIDHLYQIRSKHTISCGCYQSSSRRYTEEKKVESEVEYLAYRKPWAKVSKELSYG